MKAARLPIALALLLGACAPDPAVEFDAAALARILSLSPLGPAPADPTNRFADDPRAAALGQRLFFDPALSGSGEVSCAGCHDPARSFTDGLPLARAAGTLERHTPSLWNAAHQRWYFWDGRADSLWAQALMPLEDSAEHGGSRLGFAHRIARDEVLRAEYTALFGPLPRLEDSERFPAQGREVSPRERTLWREAHAGAEHPHQLAWDRMAAADREAITALHVHLGKAIAAYMRLLVSDDAPFDRFVSALRAGDPRGGGHLSASAQRGLALFVGRGRCFLCHSGPQLSDLEFHNIGVPGQFDDPGRVGGITRLLNSPFRGDGAWSDDAQSARLALATLPRHLEGGAEFKTPTLRNVARSAPYMHQGQLASLREVLEHYSKLDDLDPRNPLVETILTPLELSAAEVDDLVAFLESLTDEDLPEGLTRAPD